jgi:arylsulfatase A-like enzyme
MKTSKPTRRQFIASSAALALGMGRRSHAQKPRKPNLLFIWTDEQRRDTMAVYGNQRIHAPNLNMLASECLIFKKAYCSQPVCTPSRSSIMTGLWPHATECFNNNIPVPKETRCFPELLSDPDYRTGYFGKWHLGDEVFAQHGFEEWAAIEDGYAKGFSKDRDPDAKSAYWHFLKDLGYEPDTESGKFSRDFAVHRPIEHCKPKFLELRACDFLRRHKNEPFILHVNFLEPHMPFYGPLNNEHAPEEVIIPPNFEDPLEDNEPLRYRLIRENLFQNGFGKLPLKTEADWRRLTANYWGLVTQVDLSVGAILAQLDALGLADNTIVVYTSDHGDMMAAHRMLAKTVLYEESSGIPWMLRIPAQGKKQVEINQPVSQIDMAPTLLDLMGRPDPSTLPGHSLVPLMKGEKAEEDHVYIEWNPPDKVSIPDDLPPTLSREAVEQALLSSSRTVVSPDGWKLTLGKGDKSQLFDLNKDPYETTNLFDSPAQREVISRLAGNIHRWQERVKDGLEV